MLSKASSFILLVLMPVLAFAQTDDSQFKVYEDGVQIQLSDSVQSQIVADFNSARQTLLTWLTAEGFLNAEIDSMEQKRAQVTRGCEFQLNKISVQYRGGSEGQQVIKPNIRYTQKALQEEIKALISELTASGYLFAQSNILQFTLDAESCSVSVALEIITGSKAEASGIYFSGAENNSEDYLNKISRFRPGQAITPDYLQFLRANLNNSGLFNTVGEGQVLLREGEPVIVFEVQERSLNRFDGLLGYVPDAAGNGQIVGDVELSLWNVLTQGNGFDFHYQRLRPETSQLNLEASQNWIGNIPVGVSAGFQLYQNDTTYQSRDFDLTGYYLLNSGFKLIGGLGFQSTTSGNNLPAVVEPDGQKRTARLGFEYTNLDRFDVPTSGSSIRLMFGIANKDIADDSSTAFTQNVLELTARNYISIFNQSVIATSLHGFLLESDRVTTNDLSRFGGANSFRGYAEEQFRAGQLLWGDVEYQFLIDRQSYLFVFGAFGRYHRPKLLTETNNQFQLTKNLYSTGFGLSYQTRIGRLKFTYAISPEETIGNGKVHFGIRTEL